MKIWIFQQWQNSKKLSDLKMCAFVLYLTSIWAFSVMIHKFNIYMMTNKLTDEVNMRIFCIVKTWKLPKIKCSFAVMDLISWCKIGLHTIQQLQVHLLIIKVYLWTYHVGCFLFLCMITAPNLVFLCSCKTSFPYSNKFELSDLRGNPSV